MRSRSSGTATQTFQWENSVDSRPGYTINACFTASPVHPRTQFPSPRLRVGYRNRKLGYSRDLEGKVPCEGAAPGLKELSGTVLRNAQAVNEHYGCNPTQLVCHLSVIASLQTLSTAKVARRLRMREFAVSLPRIHTQQRRWHGATTSYLRLNSEGVDDDCVRQIVWTNTARLRAGWLLAMGHHVCQTWRSWREGHRIQ